MDLLPDERAPLFRSPEMRRRVVRWLERLGRVGALVLGGYAIHRGRVVLFAIATIVFFVMQRPGGRPL